MKKPRSIGFLIALALSLIVLIPFRESILRTAAHLWIIDDIPEQADIILLPGGQIATRPPMAARLYLEGRAPGIFILRESPNPLLHADTPGEERADFVADYLRRAGVQSSALYFSDGRPDTTWDEATQFANWWNRLPQADRPGTAFLVTDAFHSRRARWCFQKQIPEMEFTIVTVPHRYYHPGDWWRSPQGVEDFRSEVAKMLAYWIRY